MTRADTSAPLRQAAAADGLVSAAPGLEPAESGLEPAASGLGPAASALEPAASAPEPAASGLGPAASALEPAASDAPEPPRAPLPPGLRVRIARTPDAAAIADVHVRAWQQGYRGLLPDALLDTLSPQLRELQWRVRLSGASREWITTLAALEHERIVGFCSIAAPSRDLDAGTRTAEIAAFYVDPSRWGRGVADTLMHAARELLMRDPVDWETLTLWKLEGNARARAFYRRWGMRPDGTRRDDLLAAPGGREVSAPHQRLRGPLV